MNTFKKYFLLILGSLLMVIPFYASSMEMLLLTEKEAAWTNTHWIFFCIGAILFAWGLSGVKQISEIAISMFKSSKDNNSITAKDKKKKGGGATTPGTGF